MKSGVSSSRVQPMQAAGAQASRMPAASGASAEASFKLIADRLVCPACSGRLEFRPEAVRCTACTVRYPVREGVLMLARLGTAETWGEDPQPADSSDYQSWYQEAQDAAQYNAEYRQFASKRLSTRREFTLLRRLLETQGHGQVILDLPCGGGRLSPAIAPFAALLIEADIGFGQVLHNLSTSEHTVPKAWMTASAFHIPLGTGRVDGVVCCRLCHHLPTDAERARLMKEILRVSRRFAIMTFFDHHSVKNTLRRIRQPFDHKPPKMTMTIQRVAELARENGAELVAWPALSRLFSGHRYALMVKRGA
jgi:SAM-dependent methyltransferase